MMIRRQPAISSPWPKLWLISDARNNAALERALARLPRGSGFIYRHYHLPAEERRARFSALARIARARGHWVVLADDPRRARRWGADGSYGAPLRGRTLVTAHSLRELARAHRAGAHAVLLSPVFATDSHPGASALGPLRFRLIARHSRIPVIALGGMDERHARRLRWPRWAAIDGLSQDS